MPTFREYLYERLSAVNLAELEDREEITELLRWLAKELVQYHDIAMAQEAKMMEVMTAKDFDDFCTDQAKKLFQSDIDAMPDCEFKQFLIDHFDEVTGDKE
jgi:hypothetical protein